MSFHEYSDRLRSSISKIVFVEDRREEEYNKKPNITSTNYSSISIQSHGHGFHGRFHRSLRTGAPLPPLLCRYRSP